MSAACAKKEPFKQEVGGLLERLVLCVELGHSRRGRAWIRIPVVVFAQRARTRQVRVHRHRRAANYALQANTRRGVAEPFRQLAQCAGWAPSKQATAL
jgi:hypothetical protein